MLVTGLGRSWESGREPPRFRRPAHAGGPHRLGTKRKYSAHPSTVLCPFLHPQLPLSHHRRRICPRTLSLGAARFQLPSRCDGDCHRHRDRHRAARAPVWVSATCSSPPRSFETPGCCRLRCGLRSPLVSAPLQTPGERRSALLPQVVLAVLGATHACVARPERLSVPRAVLLDYDAQSMCSAPVRSRVGQTSFVAHCNFAALEFA